MLSPSDTILIFVVALLLFGPEHLPKIARQLGDAMRHVQSTTNAFMAEMDRAAAAADAKARPAWDAPASGLETSIADGTSAPPPDATIARRVDAEFADELPGASLHRDDAPELEEDLEIPNETRSDTGTKP